MRRAWKFLDERARGIFSGFVWPTSRVDGEPGPWVESREVIACEQGVHACSVDQLAWWMSAQLWEIELAGPVVVEGPEMVAKRGRLMRLVADWPGLGWQQMLEDSGFDNVTIGPPVDTFGGAIGEAKARSFDVYGYAFLAHRT